MDKNVVDDLFGPVPDMTPRHLKACVYYLLMNGKNAHIYLNDFIIWDSIEQNKIIGIKISQDNIIRGSLNKDVIHMVNSLPLSQDEKKDFFKKMLKNMKSIALPVEELSWLRNDERACYWLWVNLKVDSPYIVEPGYEYSCSLFQLRNIIPHITTDTFPNADKRFNYLSSCLDSLYKSIEGKAKLLSEIKCQWDIFIKRQPPIKWIKKNNTEMCRFLWNYMKSHPSIQGFISERFNSVYMDSECYLSFVAVLDSWLTSPEAKSFFLVQAQKAWHQHNYREKQKKENRRAINAHISDDAKEKLNVMAKSRRMKINEMIEHLILKEYDSSSQNHK